MRIGKYVLFLLLTMNPIAVGVFMAQKDAGVMLWLNLLGTIILGYALCSDREL